MRHRKRLAVGGIAAIGVVLGGVLVFDVYRDWIPEGKSVLSTLDENALPMILVVGLLWAARRLWRSDRDAAFASTVFRWTALGTATMLVLVGWVVGQQLTQGELKPWLVVFQATVVGAVGGVLVGRTTAAIRATRDEAQHEEARYRALFENDPAGIVEVEAGTEDGEPTVVAANAASESVLASPDGEIAGQRLRDLLAGIEAEAIERVATCAAGGETLETEVELDADEETSYYQLKVVPYDVPEDVAGGHCFVILQDVTDIRESERKLEDTVTRLERANEHLQQFAYVASHDLQEPVRMVSSYVDLLETEYGDQLDGEAEEYMDFAVDGAERIQDMIDALLTYSRVNTEADEFELVDTDAVLDTVERDLSLLLEEEDATVTSGDLPAVVADEEQLGQVFQNLVKNGIEHGGRDEEDPRVSVSAERRDGETVFSVADNGPGVPEDQRERIFRMFEQGRADEDGTGIGLAVCKRIVNRHGGDIWVEESEAGGARFRFSVPDESAQQSIRAGQQS